LISRGQTESAWYKLYGGNATKVVRYLPPLNKIKP